MAANVAILSSIVILVFAAGYFLAKHNAGLAYSEMVTNDYPGYRRIQVWTKSHWKEDLQLKSFSEQLEAPEACFRLVFAGKSALFLFRPIKGQTALSPPILSIPNNGKEITSYRILAQELSCNI